MPEGRGLSTRSSLVCTMPIVGKRSGAAGPQGKQADMSNFGRAPHGQHRSRAGAVTVVAVLALLAVACQHSSDPVASGPAATFPLNASSDTLEPDSAPVSGGSIVVSVPAETNGWNPIYNQWEDAGSLEGASFLEPLATMKADGDSEPWLADSWTPSPDFRQWTINLHPGIEFHNGQPLDAEALKENITTQFTQGLTAIVLKSEFDHVEVTGPLSVRVLLTRPWAQYPATLAITDMMAPAMLESPDFGETHPIGTGPFQFDVWQQNKSLKVKRFDHYWRKDSRGNQLPYLDSIEFRPIVDDGVSQRALENNDVDLALTASAQVADAAQETHTVLRDYTSERSFIMLNTAAADVDGPNPFTDIHARKALALATDRASIAKSVGDQVQVTTEGFRPDSKWGLPESETDYPAFDLDASAT